METVNQSLDSLMNIINELKSKMNTKIIFVALAGVFITSMALLSLADSGVGSYEGVGIERFSDSGFQKYSEENKDYLNIVKITDEDLKEVPKIKNLIDRSLQMQFQETLNDDGVSIMKNIEVHSGLATYEITKYHKWGEAHGLSKGRATFGGTVMEYRGEYYQLKFSIA